MLNLSWDANEWMKQHNKTEIYIYVLDITKSHWLQKLHLGSFQKFCFLFCNGKFWFAHHRKEKKN
jgi:hypothetical protein